MSAIKESLPTFRPEAAARNRRILVRHRQHEQPYQVSYGPYELDLLPGVFNPCYGEGSQLMLQCHNYLSGSSILDMGTGSGALALLASESAKQVTACDISHTAVKCARRNARRHGRDNRISVFQSDLFDAIPEGERFDQIIFNTPFLQGTPRSILEQCIYDEDYSTLTRFFEQVRGYLEPGGNIVLCFGDVGDIRYLDHLIQENNLYSKIISSKLNRGKLFFVCLFESIKGSYRDKCRIQLRLDRG